MSAQRGDVDGKSNDRFWNGATKYHRCSHCRIPDWNQGSAQCHNVNPTQFCRKHRIADFLRSIPRATFTAFDQQRIWTKRSRKSRTLAVEDNDTDSGAPVRTKVFDRSPVIKGKISKWKIIPPSPTRPKPPLIRQSAQDVLLPPSREDFEQYYTPGKPLVLLGSIEKKRHYASELKAQAKEREWVGQLENKPPLDRFSTDKFTLCAYAAEYGVPAASLLAIVTYTGDDFRHINADMRREKTLHLEEMSDSVPLWKRQLIQDISTGILAMPKAQKGIVCRKIIVDEELGQKLLPGAIFMDYAFLSTSYRKNFSGIPGNYMLVIALKENRSSAVDVSRISKSPQECEVLFPPGQQFKILSREIDGIPSNEHVPYFDYDPDHKHKDMTVEEVRMRRRLVKVYMYQI